MKILGIVILLSASCFAVAGEFPDWIKTTASGSFDCNKKYCKNMSSCSEAYYKFTECGKKGLDRDKDGVPCENVCGKTVSAMQQLLQKEQ